MWYEKYMKYKEGDKVKINTNLLSGCYRNSIGIAVSYIHSNMISYKGKLATITRVQCNGINDGYVLDIDDETYLWHELLLTKVSGNRYRIK